MKKLLKVFAYFIGIIVFLVIALTITAKFAENKISEIVLKRVSEKIEAPVKIDHVSFNLLRKFPLATIELKGVLLGAHRNSNDTGIIFSNIDTIINISKIYVSVKSKPLLDGNIEVIKVDINGAVLNYLVDSTGVTNVDFLLDAFKTTEADTLPSKPLNIKLTDLSIKNVICNYKDDSLKASAHIIIPELKAEGILAGENIAASVKGEIGLSNCNLEGTNLHLMKSADVGFHLDLEKDSLNINELSVNTDGANISLEGNLILKKDIRMDLAMNGSDLILGELVKYIPKEMLKELGLERISGKLNLEATAKGVFSKSEVPLVKLNVDLQKGSIFASNYPMLKNISCKGKITNGILRNNKSTQLSFSSFHFETEKSKFNASFSILDIDHPKYDVKTDMEIYVNDFKKYIPEKLIKNIDGKVKLSLTTKGELPDQIGDDFVDYLMAKSHAKLELTNFNIDVDSVLSVKDFSVNLVYKPNDLEISELNVSVPVYKLKLINSSFEANLTGSINNPAKMGLDIKSYHIETEKSQFSGYAKIQNFDNPYYALSSNIKLNLDEIKTMLPENLLTTLTGKLSLNIESTGIINLKSIVDDLQGIIFNSSSFSLNFENVSVEMPDQPMYKLENFSGLVAMDQEAITINSASGIAGGIEFEIDSTRIGNVYKTIIKNKKEQLTIDTRISLGDLNYTMFTPFLTTDTAKVVIADQVNNEVQEKEPSAYTMFIKGTAKVKSFTYDKAYIQDISSLFNIKDSVYTIDQLKFKAFNGNMNTSVKYTIKPDKKATIEMHNIIEKMDIKKLLYDFDNFKDFKDYYQPSITHENLSGLFSTDLYSRFVMENDTLNKEEMRVKGVFSLENGGVYNFEPARLLAKEYNINEFDNMKFKTLESKIFIFKNAIFVPETFISSNEIDVTAYGMQSFGEDYEYHLEVHLSDILRGKKEKLWKEQAKYGDSAGKDERTPLKLISYSINGEDKTGFDNATLSSTMRGRISAQERLFTVRFKTGWFNFETNVYPKKK